MTLRLRDLLSGQPYPSRGAVDAVRRRITHYLISERPVPGTPLATDAQLVRYSGLSRSTVRRALTQLQRDGWVLREVGRGTYVGPRVGVVSARANPADTQPPEVDVDVSVGDDSLADPPIRLGVLIFDIANLAGDWFTPDVLKGIDRAADRHDVQVELIGAQESGTDAIARRIRQSKPDVLACLANDLRQLLVLRDCQQMKIPVLVAGTPFASVGFPAVSEDNEEAMRIAVRHLVRRGHERPGLIHSAWPGSWVSERHLGYELEVRAHGQEPLRHFIHVHHAATNDELWYDDMPLLVDRCARWLETERPTAVVCGSFMCTEVLGLALERVGWSVPDDLSVVCFDQHPKATEWLGVRPTTMALPLKDIGAWLAITARAIVSGHKPSGHVRLPVPLVEGQSVRTHDPRPRARRRRAALAAASS